MTDKLSTWLPSLNSLRALEVVSRHLNFQKAAQELKVTSAAVQQLVRGLEAALNRQLVLRDGRSLRLTACGQSAVNDLNEGFNCLNRAVSKIRLFNDRQQLRISVGPSFASSWLISRLSRFQTKNDDIDVLIDSSDRIVDLDKHEADIAIRYCRKTEETNNHLRLFEDEIIAVCSPSILANKALLAPKDLKEFPLIHYDWPFGISTQMDWSDWIIKMGFDVTVSSAGLRITDYDLALQSITAGMGVGLASRPLVEEAIKSGLLINPFGKGIGNGYGYSVLIAPGLEQKPGLQEFVSWVVTEARA